MRPTLQTADIRSGMQVHLPLQGFRRLPVLEADRSLFGLQRLKDFLRHAVEVRHRLRTCVLVTPRLATSGSH